jgi:hypothetical protein
MTSLDGSEAVLSGGGGGGAPTLFTTPPAAAVVALTNSDVSVKTFPSATNFIASQDATLSPFGGPFLAEWQVVTLPRVAFNPLVTVPETMFKVWGENAVNGRPFQVVPIASGDNVTLSAQRQSDANKTLLLSYQLNGTPANGYAVQVPIAGRAPLKPLLP